jgi:hypothetical protein
LTTAPAISGKPAVGKTLSCSPGTYGGDNPLTSDFQWQRDGKAIAGATERTHKVTLADAGHKLSCQVTETNPYGHTTATSSAKAVPFPTPSLGRIHQSHKRWRRGSKLARVSRKRTPVGTTLRFTLNVLARLTLTFTAAAHKRPGGALSVMAKHSGKVRIHFAGRLSRRRRLTSGHYRLTISAKAHGRRSKPRTSKFTIVG